MCINGVVNGSNVQCKSLSYLSCVYPKSKYSPLEQTRCRAWVRLRLDGWPCEYSLSLTYLLQTTDDDLRRQGLREADGEHADGHHVEQLRWLRHALATHGPSGGHANRGQQPT